MPMSDAELCQHLKEAEGDAIKFNSIFGHENEENLSYYLGEPFGNEVPEQSQVVSTDVADVVESDMPSLARVFLGSGNIVTFQPNNESEAEINEAEEKTKYINWLVREQPHSYQTIFGWLKDSEIQKFGAVKYFIEDVETTTEVSFKGLTELEVEQTKQDLDNDNVSKIDVVKETEVDSDDEEKTFDITLRVTTKSGNRAMFKGVATENFLITRKSSSVDEAEMVGDYITSTRGELKAMKVPVSKINLIPKSGSKIVESERMNRIRFSEEGEESDTQIQEWASEKVELIDEYVRIDFDEDGVAERRRILKARFAEVIIINEAFDHVPYAVNSTIMMPHKAIGRSRTDVTKSNQLQKSKILRESLDNLELVNHPGIIVNDDKVNIDDMLTIRSGRIIRTDGIPQQDAFPLVIPSVLSESLQMIQYLDFARAQTTGTLLASQGLNSDDLTDETATRFQGVQDEGSAKIELVARGLGEVGFVKLYEGLAWMVSQFQDAPIEIMVLGKALTVDPRKWKFQHRGKSEVGLGAGDNEKLLSTLSGIYQVQQQLKAQGSALTDEADIYNTLDRIIKGSGLPRTDEFFNDPEKPEELLQAENEILTRTVQQLQEMVQNAQNPLAEAENIRAQAKLIEAEGKQELAAANMLKDMSEFREEMKLEFAKLREDARQSDKDTAVQITKLELENNTDLPGGLDEAAARELPTEELIGMLDNA